MEHLLLHKIYSLAYCLLLKDRPLKLSCVSDVVEILSILDSSKRCVGNDDERFEQIADVHKGVFKDKTGNQHVCQS